jgi:ABC-type transport system substrate-binding protein
MAESYEITDTTTVTVKLRQGIYWHEIGLLSAREFSAEVVQYSYDAFWVPVLSPAKTRTASLHN